MSNESPVSFEPYPCSLGNVTAHEGSSYVVTTPDGRTIGIPANGTPSEASVEADIASPPAPRLTAAEVEHLADTLLDGWAREWGYTTAARCATYVGDPDEQFNAEGTAMRNARSSLWRGLANAAAAAGPSIAPTREEAVALIESFKPVRPIAPFA